ncbi:hypothetical protein [Melittangium boletus]|uniref:Uncharacterized protein n=1 Tax=Melittangium boletus DSM 14713 TaxID=1294270 RepID=A0A250IFH1_9BACT|nr:hypothetical protein [Melittangium boletus]ATB30515.1 hypothetical protein MEBOL_003976 [Melittangium boletus DSM 14713]
MAVATCARCGTFLCGECTELIGETAACADCFALLHRRGTPSWALTLALGLQGVALVSAPLVLLLPFQVRIDTGQATIVLPLLRRVPVLNLLAFGAGWFMASRELRRLERADLPSRARTMARATRVLAVINLGFVLLQGLLVLRLLLGLFGR